jgi:hypothetical protein
MNSAFSFIIEKVGYNVIDLKTLSLMKRDSCKYTLTISKCLSYQYLDRNLGLKLNFVYLIWLRLTFQDINCGFDLVDEAPHS